MSIIASLLLLTFSYVTRKYPIKIAGLLLLAGVGVMGHELRWHGRVLATGSDLMRLVKAIGYLVLSAWVVDTVRRLVLLVLDTGVRLFIMQGTKGRFKRKFIKAEEHARYEGGQG